MIQIASSSDTIQRLRQLTDNLRYLDKVSANSTVEIKNIDAVTPLAITPVASVINAKQLKYEFKGNTSDYLKVIHFPEGVEKLGGIKENKTFLPIIHLHLESGDRSARSELLSKLHSAFLKLLKQNIIADEQFIKLITDNTFGFVISEMLDNIEQHSDARNVYLFGQYWQSENVCEVCLLDDGIGIYKSLVRGGRNVANNRDAIEKVINERLSAKAEPGLVERGTGIYNTRQALTSSEINGEFLLLSGNSGYLQVANQKGSFLSLQNLVWQGTIVMMKLHKPLKPFNLYDYVS